MTVDQIIASIQISSEEANRSKGISEMLSTVECSHLTMILLNEEPEA